MRWYYVATSGTTDKAIDLIYCEQDLSVLFRDIIGTPPYNLANELVYCEQNLSVLFRDIIGTPPYNLANELVYCEQDLSVLDRTP